MQANLPMRSGMDDRLQSVYKGTNFQSHEEERFIMTDNDAQKQQAAQAQGDAVQQGSAPDPAHLHAAITHVDEGMKSGNIAAGAAKGLLFSLTETLGALVGDPDLPEHVRAGYEGLLEATRKLLARLEHQES